jgi:hypothetical protein
MKRRSRFYLLTIVLLGAGVIAFYCRKKLAGAYASYPSYNALYHIRDGLHISSIHRLSKGYVEVVFEGANIRAANHFEVYEKGERVMDMLAPNLRIQPGKGLKVYEIVINSRDSFTMEVEMPVINIPSLPLMQDRLEDPSIWCMYDTLSPGEAHSGEIRRYLEDSMQIRPFESSEVRVKKIARYILSVTSGKYGSPAAFMAHLTPVEQLQYVQAGRSRLLCGGYSDIFSFFSNKAGIPCRYIEAGGPADELSYAPHVVNEVWLKEPGCWAYVDLTDGIVFAKKGGHFLNTVDLQRLLRSHIMDTSYKALHYEGDSLISVPFERTSFAAIRSFDQNTHFLFYYGRYRRLAAPDGLMQKIKSLLSAQAYYAAYSDSYSPANDRYYLRLCSGYIFLLVSVIWLWSLFRWAVRRR